MRTSPGPEQDLRNLENTTETITEVTKEWAQTKDFLEGILHSSSAISIILTDFDQNVLFWNRGAENIFGYTAEEMIGAKITRLYQEDGVTAKTVEMLRQQILQKGGTLRAQVRQLAKDGRELIISLAISPMIDAGGTVRGILGIGQDITEEARLHEELLESYKRMQRIQRSSIFALARLAEFRDEETGQHLKRMQDYCRTLSCRVRLNEKYSGILSEEFIDDLVQSSLLHDIGKVWLPDSILFKPAKFNREEYDIMKRHCTYGAQALEQAADETEHDSFLAMGRHIAYYHHERWDGTGYPSGLSGEEIPLAARIVAIADVYDALTTERRYKRAYPHEEACSLIIENKGHQFDPDLVDAFLEVEQEFRKIREQSPKADRFGSLKGSQQEPT
ncbi:MAG: HD domain-containing phosphohydrolase [Desulfomonilaceae bacterium]